MARGGSGRPEKSDPPNYNLLRPGIGLDNGVHFSWRPLNPKSERAVRGAIKGKTKPFVPFLDKVYLTPDEDLVPSRSLRMHSAVRAFCGDGSSSRRPEGAVEARPHKSSLSFFDSYPKSVIEVEVSLMQRLAVG